jgi:uncharacterized protein involved in exopolysaccharide biosynthesis
MGFRRAHRILGREWLTTFPFRLHIALSMSLENRQNVPETGRGNVSSNDEISLINVLNVFLRQRWFILSIATGVALATTIVILSGARTYTVESSFIIQKRDQPPVAGLAAQLGMDVNGVDATQSPAFYAALIKTPDVLDRLVDTTFTTSTDPKPKTLASTWKISNDNVGVTRRSVIDKLQKVVSSSVSQKLDLVVLRVTTGDPELSRQLAEAILRQVNWFNLQTRQSRAAAERQFDERLVAEVGADLRRAEDETQQFFQRNQQPRMSAELEMEKQRLTRHLEILNARYVSVVTAYDRARIDEVRDTPVITVIQRPRLPISADSRSLPRKTLLMFLLALALGSIAALVRHALASVRSSIDGDAKEFHQLLDETSGDVRRLWTIVGPRSRRKRASSAVNR